jgi:hypothetical protein
MSVVISFGFTLEKQIRHIEWYDKYHEFKGFRIGSGTSELKNRNMSVFERLLLPGERL